MSAREKVVIVTGGGSGIGRATALKMAQGGASAVVVDRNLAAAEGVASECGAGAFALEVDVSSEASVRRMTDTVRERCGRIDVLVNNAGFGITGSVVHTDEADWDRLMATNLKGMFLCAKAAIPVMAAGGGGAIVNTASYTATVGIADRAAYVASKGGIVALTRAMALDHAAANIRVNAVAPGTIESPYLNAIFARATDPEALRRQFEARSPMNRLGRPEEIANMIAWLASDEASFATGAVFTVDGGSSAW